MRRKKILITAANTDQGKKKRIFGGSEPLTVPRDLESIWGQGKGTDPTTPVRWADVGDPTVSVSKSGTVANMSATHWGMRGIRTNKSFSVPAINPIEFIARLDSLYGYSTTWGIYDATIPQRYFRWANNEPEEGLRMYCAFINYHSTPNNYCGLMTMDEYNTQSVNKRNFPSDGTVWFKIEVIGNKVFFRFSRDSGATYEIAHDNGTNGFTVRDGEYVIALADSSWSSFLSPGSTAQLTIMKENGIDWVSGRTVFTPGTDRIPMTTWGSIPGGGITSSGLVVTLASDGKAHRNIETSGSFTVPVPAGNTIEMVLSVDSFTAGGYLAWGAASTDFSTSEALTSGDHAQASAIMISRTTRAITSSINATYNSDDKETGLPLDGTLWVRIHIQDSRIYFYHSSDSGNLWRSSTDSANDGGFTLTSGEYNLRVWTGSTSIAAQMTVQSTNMEKWVRAV